MTEETSPAGDGQNDNPAPLVELLPPRPDDDALRRLAVERLADHLDIGASLIERCETLAFAQRGDRLGPIYAAARLMRAQAHVADALAHVAQVERRRRSIVERIQPVPPKPGDLIPKLTREEALASMQQKLDRLLFRQKQDGLQSAHDPQQEANDRLWIEDWKEKNGRK
ncbi:MAG: hypothetical protein ACXWLK_10425 [Rhizomicrobium sp.]